MPTKSLTLFSLEETQNRLITNVELASYIFVKCNDQARKENLIDEITNERNIDEITNEGILFLL